MILDYCCNVANYYKLIPELENGMKFIQVVKSFSAGKYDGDGMFAIVEEGITGELSEKEYEKHEKYIDFHVLMQGEEKIAWETTNNLQLTTVYHPEKDIAFYKGNGHEISLKENMFCIYFPSDGHKCGGKTAEVGTPYKKIILKLPMDS